MISTKQNFTLNYFKTFCPWLFFLIFLTSNVLLCCFPLPSWSQLFVLFVGIIVPLIFAISRFSRETIIPTPILFDEFLYPIPKWLWFLLTIGVIFIHFYKFGSFPVWPSGDEGLFGLFGLQLSEKWNWSFFYTVAQHSPLLIWLLSFSLPFFKSPYWGLWSVPALLSLITIFLTYITLRIYFSRSFSFLGTCLGAFSLCSFNCGRLCSTAVLLLPWELLCFWISAIFSKETRLVYKKIWSIFLGILAGMGYFTFPSWPVVSLSVVLFTFTGNDKKQLLKNKNYFLWFVGAFLLALTPLFFAICIAGYGEHINAMSRFNHWFSWKEQWISSVSYISAIFWGPWGSFSWQDNSLEKLNPFLGACFFLGCIQIYRYRSFGIVQWIGLIFIFYFLPGLLSGNFEIFRIIQVYPFLILIAALGLACLLGSFPRNRRLILLLGLIFISISIDGYRVFQTQTDPLSSPTELALSLYPVESIRTYRILKELSKKAGPGLIFTEFMQVPKDNCLLVMTYTFNAAENIDLISRGARWAAVVANLHYYSFLSKRFPEAHWYWVHDGRTLGSESVLGIIPINEKNSPTLSSWVQAHHYFRQLSLAIDNISEKNTYRTADEIFNHPPSCVIKDKFLQSCYWERRAQFYYDYHFEVHYNDQVFALRQAMTKGYPSAHLYYELGCLLARKGNFEQARSNFRSALKIEPQYLSVIETIKYLQTATVKMRYK